MSTPTVEPESHHGFQHFLRLALRGRVRGCSSGEVRCRRIARCLLENLPGLDGAAVAGIHRFIDVVEQNPSALRDALDLWED